MLKSAMIFAAAGILLSAANAHAQSLPRSGPCPGGAVPSNGTCVSPAVAAANRGSGAATPAYTEVWEDRYGALALDLETGAMGASEGATSRRRAIKEALKLCGSKKCVSQIDVRNACIASSWGGRTRYIRGGEQKDEAESRVMTECQAEFSDCRLSYSYCSFPVRVK